MRGPFFWRDLGVCLSLVNLLYLLVWRMTLALSVSETYYLPGGPVSSAFFLRPIGVVVGAALVLFALGRAVRRTRRTGLKTVARLTFLLLALCALNAVRHLVELSAGRVAAVLGWPLLAICAALVAVLVVVGGLRWSRQAVRGVSTLLLVSLPFFPITVARSVGRVVAHRSLDEKRFSARSYRAPARARPTPSPRVVVVVFDELDQRFLPPSAARGVSLPAFEALRNASFWSENALAPGNGTLESMPAYLSELSVAGARPLGPDELELFLAGNGGAVRWSEQPNLFQELRSLGLESALVGWYHPYCRVLGANLAYCASFAHVAHPDVGPGLDLLRQALLVGETVPGVVRLELPERLGLPRPPRVPPAWHARQYAEIHRRALEVCADPRYALVFLHFPIPHGPFLYSRRLDRIDTTGKTGTYEGNLVLADSALADLRAAMESAGLWHSSAVVVTADHGWRELGWPAPSIPFLLKMPGQAAPVHYGRRFSTRVLADLTLEILAGRLSDGEAVAAWLDRRPARE